MTNQPGERPPEPPGYGQPPSWQSQYGQSSYGQGQYGQQPGYPQQVSDHPRSLLVLILGILGIVACGLVAPFAWVMGRRTVREIDASHGALGGRSLAQAGYVLGIVGTVLLAVAAVFMVGMLLLMFIPLVAAP